MLLWLLAYYNFITSLFAFGGGSSLLSYLYDIYVLKLQILSNAEFLKISVISQILPGPVALSFLGIIGFKVNSFIGWFTSIISFTIVTTFFSALFYKYAFKIKLIQNISNYVIVVIMGALILVVLNLAKLPFNYATKTQLNLFKLAFISILTMINFKLKLNFIKNISINLICALIFVLF